MDVPFCNVNHKESWLLRYKAEWSVERQWVFQSNEALCSLWIHSHAFRYMQPVENENQLTFQSSMSPRYSGLKTTLSKNIVLPCLLSASYLHYNLEDRGQRASKTSVQFQLAIQRYIPQDGCLITIAVRTLTHIFYTYTFLRRRTASIFRNYPDESTTFVRNVGTYLRNYMIPGSLPWERKEAWAVPSLRRLVTSCPPGRPGFDPREVTWNVLWPVWHRDGFPSSDLVSPGSSTNCCTLINHFVIDAI
jgi:hypothetical protein